MTTTLTLKDIVEKVGFNTNKLAYAEDTIINKDPRDYQLEHFKEAFKHRRFGDYSEAGTGKSLTSFLYLSCWILSGKSALVVMPPSLLPQYSENFLQEVRFPQTVLEYLSIVVFNQGPKTREEMRAEWKENNSWPRVLMMSYEMFTKEQHNLPVDVYRVVLCDEAHYLKSISSNRHQALQEYIDRSKGTAFIYLMTGTPMVKNPEDAYGLIKLVTPGIYTSKRDFDRKHVITQQKQIQRNGRMISFNETVGFRNLDALSDNLYAQAKRVMKRDVLTMEEPTIIQHKLYMSPRMESAYIDMVETMLSDLPDGDVEVLTAQEMYHRCLQFLLAYPHANSIMDGLDELVESLLLEGKKVVIFCWYVATIERLLTKYDKLKLNPVAIYNKTIAEVEKNKFVNDPKVRVIIIQPQAGGVGLDGMQNVCSDCIFAEPVTTPGVFNQALSRLDRSGQKEPVTCWIISVPKTISSKRARMLLSRSAITDFVAKDKHALLKDLYGEFDADEYEERIVSAYGEE